MTTPTEARRLADRSTAWFEEDNALRSLADQVDALTAERDALRKDRLILRRAAQDSLALLRKGVPGWGIAKDILNLALHQTGEKP